MRDRAYDYLTGSWRGAARVNEGWWPAYTAWQTFAVKVLVEGGRNEDSHITRLYGYRDRMPVFALAYLHDALLAKGETTGDRVADLQPPHVERDPARRRQRARRGADRSVPALVLELQCASTAIVLSSLVKADATDAPMRQMVRWMMAARKDGRWGNTQENALAMEALVAYYRKYEPVVPDFRPWCRLAPASSRARSSEDARPRRRPPACRWRRCWRRRRRHRAAADLHARRGRDALLCGAPALRRRRAPPAGARFRLQHRARATSRMSRMAPGRRRPPTPRATSCASR